MAAKKMKVRAFLKQGGVANVKVLMVHPMETGQRKDKATGQVIPAHFIKSVDVEHNGKRVMGIMMGTAVSKNPYLSFKVLNAAAGDKVKIAWLDNKGDSDSVEATISD